LDFLPASWAARLVQIGSIALLCSGVDDAVAAPKAPSFTVVVLPDTQYYAAKNPQILEAQTQWILRRHVEDRIAFVVHEGDVVDADDPRQWTAAAHSLHELDGVVPYVLATGNHDYRRAGAVISRASSMSAYFPPAAFSNRSWFGGTFEPGKIENSFAIVDAPGSRWLIVSLEFGARDAELAWADGVVKRHATLPAMVVTHAYLDSNGVRYDRVAHPDQLWSPYRYLAAEHPGDVNDGEGIWRKLVSRNPNIRFVLCGHDLSDGVGRRDSVRPDGSVVHALLANYQAGKLGGAGFLRLMRFFPAERRVAVQTYSPFTNSFKTDAENQFTLSY
jgi:hypothetical protein